ncbi:VOC family protein [Colwellia psychrerythraea]|uniref:Glyoxalase-like domain containing protein n=1 Tax=Colwellia psychrerythraea TaxID=28229 RepID=A0A099KST2_COLPS|nr:VOC family protein [Colwellia psychrerythraea]KGJ93834.1 Glyoxalase-like domain containing protein [Colwellia psychrerythraea]
MNHAFHLSFVVPNKELARSFYIDTLGCSVGRDNDTWFDILFFGHQLTIHQASEKMPAFTINHFGPILDKKEWLTVIDKCESNNVEVILPPTIKSLKTEDESGKFIVKDPSGNVLEFKYYLNVNKTVSSR